MLRRTTATTTALATLGLAIASAFGLEACGGGNSASPVRTPGAEESTKLRGLEGGAALMQDRAPISALNVYVDGFHFYNGDLQGQMEAHHYCSTVNEDVIQCAIYD